MDDDDLDHKLEVIGALFKENGLSFETFHEDVSIADYDNTTTVGRFPTFFYGVWHPTATTGSPVPTFVSHYV